GRLHAPKRSGAKDARRRNGVAHRSFAVGRQEHIGATPQRGLGERRRRNRWHGGGANRLAAGRWPLVLLLVELASGMARWTLPGMLPPDAGPLGAGCPMGAGPDRAARSDRCRWPYRWPGAGGDAARLGSAHRRSRPSL